MAWIKKPKPPSVILTVPKLEWMQFLIRTQMNPNFYRLAALMEFGGYFLHVFAFCDIPLCFTPSTIFDKSIMTPKYIIIFCLMLPFSVCYYLLDMHIFWVSIFFALKFFF